MKNVYGYIRVSTIKQGEGVSLEVQKDAIERYAHQNDLKIVRWFEELFSAAKTGRPLFTEMLQLLKTRKAEGAIIYKIDRSARNLEDWNEVTKIIDRNPDINIHFAHEYIDLRTRGGRLSGDVQAVFAADFSRNNRQQTVNGLYGRINQGIFPFQAPIGYVNNGKGKLKTIDRKQAPLVKKAFELYATGDYNIRSLALHMNNLGLRNVRGTKMHHNGLWQMLNNCFYIGLMEIKGEVYNGKHEPIITTSLFKKVKSILEGKANQKVAKHAFRFRKQIKCSQCHYSLIGEIQKGHVYYRCHTKGCPMKGLRETFIESQIFRHFQMIQLHPEETKFLNQELRDTEQKEAIKNQEMLAIIKLQHSQLKSKIERLTDCYVEGGLDKETFEQRKSDLLIDIKTKEMAEKDLANENGKVFAKAYNFLELATNLIKLYKTEILEERRELLEMVTSNLAAEIKSVVVSMRSPFLELFQRHSAYCGALERDTPRKMYSQSADTATFTSLPPLPKEKLKLLLDLILQSCSSLSDNDFISYSGIPKGYEKETNQRRDFTIYQGTHDREDGRRNSGG